MDNEFNDDFEPVRPYMENEYQINDGYQLND
jgi:hypothetical protein